MHDRMPRSPLIRWAAVGLVMAFAASSCATATSPNPSGEPPPPTAAASPSRSPAFVAPTPAPTPVIVTRPLVPVTDFRAPWTETSAEEVASVLAGTSKRYEALEIVQDQQAQVLAALGLGQPPEGSKLVLAPSTDALRVDLAKSRKRLAVLLADDVDPSVRALGWEGKSLFGESRVARAAAWPLQATFRADAGQTPDVGPMRYDPAQAWTLVAAGDILLDRGVARAIQRADSGADFPFDGGTVKITSRCRNCSSMGWDLPRSERTGDAGAVRDLLSGADIALANFENPAPDSFRFHSSGTVFSANPAYIEGLKDAGIDVVSLGNNHIRDAGAKGITDTIANLEAAGIEHAGAGKNLASARQPAILEAGGVKVAVLGYDTIASGYWAGRDRAGSAPMTAENLEADVLAARQAGADVVIVFPHWGTEYDPTPFAGQRDLAHEAIDAGADMVIGNHAHWAAGLEVYDGKPIWYALGNFVFDQSWSEQTMEGITLELTFAGADLVQVRMRPHLILDKAQPNFLDPAGSGAVVMGQVWAASKGLLDW